MPYSVLVLYRRLAALEANNYINYEINNNTNITLFTSFYFLLINFKTPLYLNCFARYWTERSTISVSPFSQESTSPYAHHLQLPQGTKHDCLYMLVQVKPKVIK